jgi:hypothetical protein
MFHSFKRLYAVFSADGGHLWRVFCLRFSKEIPFRCGADDAQPENLSTNGEETMTYMAIPTMAQAMANKVGTTAHPRQPGRSEAAESLFETLLAAAASRPSAAAPRDISGIWGTLMSKYLETGLTREERERAAGAGVILPPMRPAGGLAPAALGALPEAGLGDGSAGPDAGPAAGSPESRAPEAPAGLGVVSATFESGASGVDAIGYDRGGGTSYGVYQIASRTGTMDRFIDFLDGAAPLWAERLRAAGAADTGSTDGGMPRVWRAIAAEDPDRFTGLQHAFIEATHYRPAERRIEESGLRVAERSEALREALWSTAVQHGPGGAARIFRTALSRLGDGAADAPIIEQVYAHRAETADGHAPALASALRNRFRAEKRQVLDLLEA